MKIATALVLALLTVAIQDRQATVSADDLAAARTLYASGAYEDALTRLAGARPAGSTFGEVEQYRALCLLALGRLDEATAALDELATRAPMFKMSESEVSPRLVTMFRDARRRKLPTAAKDLYARAKTHFEQQSYAAASAEFKELIAILADPDLPEAEAKSLADLKMLGEGFMKLADVEIAAVEARAAAARAAAAAAAQAVAAEPPPIRIYTDADKDVKPPVEVSRTMPQWRPANAIESRRQPNGVLRVLIDEQGKVEVASLVAPIIESYDAILLEAARKWVYRPATRDGQPVKFQKLISVTLSPR